MSDPHETVAKSLTHGAGLTPDETELWISDQKGKKLFIFDATKMPPTPKRAKCLIFLDERIGVG